MAFVESTSKMFVFGHNQWLIVFSLPGVGANCDQKAMVSKGCSKKVLIIRNINLTYLEKRMKKLNKRTRFSQLLAIFNGSMKIFVLKTKMMMRRPFSFS